MTGSFDIIFSKTETWRGAKVRGTFIEETDPRFIKQAQGAKLKIQVKTSKNESE